MYLLNLNFVTTLWSSYAQPNNNNNNGNLQWHLYIVAIHPLKSGSNLNLEMLVFEERGKPEYPAKNLSEEGREPKTNSTHISRRVRDSKPGHIGGRRALSPLRHPCSPLAVHVKVFFILVFFWNFLLRHQKLFIIYLIFFSFPLRQLLNDYSVWRRYVQRKTIDETTWAAYPSCLLSRVMLI